jgi:hypothetical protein
MMLDGSRPDMTEQSDRSHAADVVVRIGLPRKKERVLGEVHDGTDWAGLMLQVRDRQDRAAFGALFRHFAPRVKAFLMKSGAGASLAEECAQEVMATLWQKAHMFGDLGLHHRAEQTDRRAAEIAPCRAGGT